MQERRQSRGTLRIFDLTELPSPADSMPPLADILLERFVYLGRLPLVISLAQSCPAHAIVSAAISSCGTDLVCPPKPDRSLFFLLALPTRAAMACWAAPEHGEALNHRRFPDFGGMSFRDGRERFALAFLGFVGLERARDMECEGVGISAAE